MMTTDENNILKILAKMQVLDDDTVQIPGMPKLTSNRHIKFHHFMSLLLIFLLISFNYSQNVN